MKLITKITVYTLALITFTLTACTAHSHQPAQPLTSFTANVVCNNEKYTVVHSGNSLTTVTYHTPTAINGLTYTYKNGEPTVNYLSLSYTPSNYTLPITNKATQLYSILTSISSNNCYLLSTTENTATYSTPIAEIICDFTTGKIKEIKPKNTTEQFKFTYIN